MTTELVRMISFQLTITDRFHRFLPELVVSTVGDMNVMVDVESSQKVNTAHFLIIIERFHRLLFDTDHYRSIPMNFAR